MTTHPSAPVGLLPLSVHVADDVLRVGQCYWYAGEAGSLISTQCAEITSVAGQGALVCGADGSRTASCLCWLHRERALADMRSHHRMAWDYHEAQAAYHESRRAFHRKAAARARDALNRLPDAGASPTLPLPLVEERQHA